MRQILMGVGICLFGYIAGSFPFALWITRLLKGVDVRDSGSGHATTTNTIRQVGWGAGVLVLILDITKGFIPTLIAIKASDLTWVVPVTASLVVVGHCWPLFAQFRGGMGLATAGGSLLAIDWIAGLIGLAILISLTLLIKHSARAAFFTGLLLAPVYFLMGIWGNMLWASALVGAVLAIRFTSDWRREYRELWLDRE
ncbi:glycerol-3-phosphate acyltransferase [Chloroflexota bacterium]